MSNQRPPGGIDDPTQDPERERPDQSAARPPWVDPNRTQRYEPRRSIADRLRGESREPDPPSQQDTALPEIGAGSTLRPGLASSPKVRSIHRSSGGLRLAAVLIGIIVLGLAGGAAAAWLSGWRPSFLGSTATEPAKPAPEKPAPTPAAPEAKPNEPPPPPTPPPAEIARSCFTGTTELKAGTGACGFALDAAGVLTFQGGKITERLAAGSGAAQRLVLYPMSPSRRFVFLRACDAPSGGRCEAPRLVDTKEKKIVEVKGVEGFAWVAWSPKEQVGLIGRRDGLSDTIAVIGTADGKIAKSNVIRTARNRYALVRAGSLRWRDEESFSVEVKLCPLAKGRARNVGCEKDEDVRYRRRTVKF